EAACVAEPESGRRVEREHERFLDVARLSEELADERGGRNVALIPVLLRHENSCRAVPERPAEKVEAGEGDDVLVRGIRLDRLQYFGNDLVGALERCTVRQENRGD